MRVLSSSRFKCSKIIKNAEHCEMSGITKMMPTVCTISSLFFLTSPLRVIALAGNSKKLRRFPLGYSSPKSEPPVSTAAYLLGLAPVKIMESTFMGSFVS